MIQDMTHVQAFSISEIATANCDMGQNYKNLVGYVKGLGKLQWSPALPELQWCWGHDYGNVLWYISMPYTGTQYTMEVDFGCKIE